MSNFAALLQQGAAGSWLFIPSAILLGALHGLEPGHSKTMMAAFIIAIRGTVAQAVMLGVAATLSHTAVVWAVALIGMHFGSQDDIGASEPYFQLGSAVMIIGIALWMMWRTRQQQHASAADHHHDHPHHEHHGHDAHETAKLIDTGHGVVRLEVFEDGVPPRFRLYGEDARSRAWLTPPAVSAHTERTHGLRQSFNFLQRDGFLESEDSVPEPHEFVVRLDFTHAEHTHHYDVEYIEHGHAHAVAEYAGLDVAAPGYQDPHELAHANDIRRRFTNREVTNGQILMFGLTGGLIPCPASITVLLLCLQLKKVTLGAVLVLSFSVGLALTLVFSGVVAALSIRHVTKRWSGFGDIARRAPYFSGAVILLVGVYVGYQGLRVILA